MKATLGLMFLLLFLTASCSRDERPNKWVFLTKDKDNTLFYTFDKMSKNDQHLVKIWVKTVFHEMRRIDDTDVSYAKNMFMIKCDAQKYKMNVGFYYSPSDTMVSRTDTDLQDAAPLITNKQNRETPPKSDTTGQDEYQPIPPGSPADRLYGIVCR